MPRTGVGPQTMVFLGQQKRQLVYADKAVYVTEEDYY